MIYLSDWFFSDFLDLLFGIGGKRKAYALPISVPVAVPENLLMLSDSYGLDLNAFDQDGLRASILASSRQGKSYIAGKLIEQLLKKENLVFIFDPEGEYYTLQEKFPIVILGGVQEGNEKRLPLSKESAIQAFQLAILENFSIVFDFSDLTDPDKCDYFNHIGDYIFKYMDSLPRAQRFNIMVVIEEAAIFCPQKPGNKLAKESVITAKAIATRGGKRGIDSLTSTQRLSEVDKTIFSQGSWFLFGRVISPQDYKQVSEYTEKYGLGKDAMMNLQAHHFYSCHHGSATLMKSGKRECTHGGATPVSREKRQRTKSLNEIYNELKVNKYEEIEA